MDGPVHDALLTALLSKIMHFMQLITLSAKQNTIYQSLATFVLFLL